MARALGDINTKVKDVHIPQAFFINSMSTWNFTKREHMITISRNLFPLLISSVPFVLIVLRTINVSKFFVSDRVFC